MADLFNGTPQTATSTSTSTTATPDWMANGIYNNVQKSQAIANAPYESYALPTVAEMSPLQLKAQQEASQTGSWKPGFDNAMASLQGAGGAQASGAVAPWLSQAAAIDPMKDAQGSYDKQTRMLDAMTGMYGMPQETITNYGNEALKQGGLQAAAPYLQKQAEMLGGINYGQGSQAMTSFLTQAGQYDPIGVASQGMNEGTGMARTAGAGNTADRLRADNAAALSMSGIGAAQPYFGAAMQGMTAAGNINTEDRLRSDQQQYLNPGAQQAMMQAGQNYYGQAGTMNAVDAASPWLQQAGQTTAQSLSERAIGAASPYANVAAQSSASNVNSYMNPYNEGVTDRIAQLGARNLSENLLPAVSDAFIRAGQFGGSRMGEFGSRALRDTQDSVLAQQAQALQQGYGQSLQASQADLARQAQLAGTMGGIAQGDLSRILQGGSQYANIGQTEGQLTAQQMQNLTALGNAQTSAGQAQQQFGLTAAQQAQQAATQDAARKLQAAQAQASLGQAAGQLTVQQQQAMMQAAQSGQQAQTSDYARQLQAAQQISDNGRNMGALTQAQQQLLLNAGTQAANVLGNENQQRLSGAQQAGQFASTVGNLANTQQNAIINVGQNIGNAQYQALGQGLTAAGQYGGQGSSIAGVRGNQQQVLGGLGQSAATAASADASRAASAASSMGSLAQAGASMRASDIALLSSAGDQQQQFEQRQLDEAKRQWQEEQNYAKRQLEWEAGMLRGAQVPQVQTSTTTNTGGTYSPSPLSQVASGLSIYKGLGG